MDNWDPRKYMDDPLAVPIHTESTSKDGNIMSRLFNSTMEQSVSFSTSSESTNTTTQSSFRNYEQLPSNYDPDCSINVESSVMNVSLMQNSDDISMLSFLENYYDMDSILEQPNAMEMPDEITDTNQDYYAYKHSMENISDDTSIDSQTT